MLRQEDARFQLSFGGFPWPFCIHLELAHSYHNKFISIYFQNKNQNVNKYIDESIITLTASRRYLRSGHVIGPFASRSRPVV
jgi:hypothetical protein